MQFVPWRYVADWRCIACGDCCKLYSVVINFHEWLKIVKTYGVEQTASGLDKLFIKRRPDGWCTFLDNSWGRHACGIQYMKPKACQIWPFKILARPEYGYPNEAAYWHSGKCLFVYADPMCNGIRYGTPTFDFANTTLKEFAEISLGARTYQYRTTASIGMPRPYVDFGSFSRNY
jgi:Fe-S-cluster containining protein